MSDKPPFRLLYPSNSLFFIVLLAINAMYIPVFKHWYSVSAYIFSVFQHCCFISEFTSQLLPCPLL